MDAVFVFGAEYLFLSVPLIAGIYFFKQSWDSKKKMIIFGTISVSIICIIAFTASYLYNDPRPFVVGHFTPLVAHAPDNGFPSDHVLLVSAIATIVYYFNRKVSFALLVITILVAISRVYVGVHHPIDVIASIIFSFVGTFIAHTLLTNIQRRKNLPYFNW